MSQGQQGATKAISAALIKELREKTGAGMMDCRKALEQASGNLEKAVLVLRERGMLAAEKKKDRAAGEGRIESYIHFGGKIGTLVEVNCETDFVAKTQEFHDLCRNVAMQVAAANPKWLSRDSVPKEVVEEERKSYEAAGKGSDMEKRLDKFFQANCLLEQPFIKEQDRSVSDMIKATIAKTGENIIVRRFARFALGDDKG